MKHDAAGKAFGDTNSSVTLKRAWAQGNYNNFTVKLGKMEMTSGEAYQAPGALVLDDDFSGAEVTFGNLVKAKVQAGRLNASPAGDFSDKANYQSVGLQYETEKLTAGAGYYRLDSRDFNSNYNADSYNNYGVKAGKDKLNIWSLNGAYHFDKNVALTGAYAYSSDIDRYKKSGQVSLEYKGADEADKGSWGAYVSYRHLGDSAFLATDDGVQRKAKGIELGTSYTLWKNVVLSAKYFNGKTLEKKADDKVQKLFGRVEFLF